MAQEGTSPVPSQDDAHISTPSPTPSKTPRTLSFISNVQTAVAQIEDKLASSPSAYPPPPSRNEIPVTPPGPDDPVIDRVQFLESSLAISPMNNNKISSLAESAFGGAINPDPSLASTGVFVSTTPPTSLNQATSNPSGRQAATDILNHITATVETRTAPSIAPIVEQFETPVTPVVSKENDSEIVGAPIAPIVEHFESPKTATRSSNEQDLVEFASGMVAPIVDQFESSSRPKPDASTLEQMESNNMKQKTTYSENSKAIEQRVTPQHETPVRVKSDSPGSYDEVAQSTSSGYRDRQSQNGFSTVQNLPVIPVVEGLEALPESSESGDLSKDEVTRKEAVEPVTELVTVPTEDGTTATLSGEDDVSSDPSFPNPASASSAEPDTMQREAEVTPASGESNGQALAANHREKSEEVKPNEPSDIDSTVSLEATSLPSVAEEEDLSVDTTPATVPQTVLETNDVDTVCDGHSPEEIAEGIALKSEYDNKEINALVENDSEHTGTEATKVTSSQATNENDDAPIDDTEVEDVETEKVSTATAGGQDDNGSEEVYTLNESAQAVSIDCINSKNDHSTTFDTNASANETTTSIVTETVNSSDVLSESSAAVDSAASADEDAKADVCEFTNSDEGVDRSTDQENQPNEASDASTANTEYSSSENITRDNDNTVADETRIPNVREVLDATAEIDDTSKVQTSGRVTNMDLPVTSAIPAHSSSAVPEGMRPPGHFVESRNVFSSIATNRSKDATTMTTEAGTPDIQLDNSMNITIVVQTAATPVSAGVTINTDESTRVGNQPSPRSTRTIPGGVQAPAEEHTATALENHEANEERASVTKEAQESTTPISSLEEEAAESVGENDLSNTATSKADFENSDEEQPAAPEQDSLGTVATRARIAHKKLSKACPDEEAKSPDDSSLGSDSQSPAAEMKTPGMVETSDDSSTITSTQTLRRRESLRSKSSTHAELRSPSSSSRRTKVEAGSRTNRQSFTRGAATLSFTTKKILSAANSAQKQEKKAPQSAPVSPLRLPKSSSNSLPRLPRVAGLSTTRSGSANRSRPSPNDHATNRIPRSSTFSSSIPKASSRLSSPILPRRSGLTSSPATPKGAGKPSEASRLPLRRTLSFTNSRMFDSPSPGSSGTRYSLSQKVEEMRRASSNRASAAHFSGSGSKPPLGRRPRVTVPEPFALFGPELHELSEKQMDDARRRQDEEAARPRVFKPRPLPNFLKADMSKAVRKEETKN